MYSLELSLDLLVYKKKTRSLSEGRGENERLESVRVPLRGECDLETVVTSSMLRLIHSVEALVRMFQTLDS
jgi:hypothetical protein